MVRLNRRSWVCPAGCSVSFHTIRTDTGWSRWGPAGTVCGWVEHKYQFMLNKNSVRCSSERRRAWHTVGS
jgi:hypothetical protein